MEIKRKALERTPVKKSKKKVNKEGGVKINGENEEGASEEEEREMAAVAMEEKGYDGDENEKGLTYGEEQRRSDVKKYERKLDEREKLRELENEIRKISLDRNGMMREIGSLKAENENNSQELSRLMQELAMTNSNLQRKERRICELERRVRNYENDRVGGVERGMNEEEGMDEMHEELFMFKIRTPSTFKCVTTKF